MLKANPVRLGIAALLVFAIVGVAYMMNDENEQMSEDELTRFVAAEQAAYSAAIRQQPVQLTSDSLVTGSLDTGDARGSNSVFEDYFVYVSDDTTSFRLQLTSGAFAPDLVVTAPDGRRIAASALRQTMQRAEITGLAGPGRFDITVTSQEAGESGVYELSVDRPQNLPVLSEGDGPLSDDLGIDGALRAGRYVNRYQLELRAGNPVVITACSRAYTPTLQVLGPEGELTEPWGTLEQHQSNDGVHVASFRFRPTHQDAYMLYVSSVQEEVDGQYELSLTTVRKRAIATNGTLVSGTLGEQSWYSGGRYIDTFRFDGYAGDSLEIRVSSDEFDPSLELRAGDRVMSSGSSQRPIEIQLNSTGQFEVEVSSVAEGVTGRYAIRVTARSPKGLRSQVISTETSRVGQTNRSHHFEVKVSRVDIQRVAEDRARVRIHLEEKSLDFEGEWDEWSRRVRFAFLTDNTGRRYTAAPAEATGGEGNEVAEGGTRTGMLTFYGNPNGATPRHIVLHYPIGLDRGVVVPVSIPLAR